MASKLTIGLLGPLQVSVGGRAVDLPRGRVRALAAVLALSPGRPVPAETLLERVWGDQRPTDAGASLHTSVKRLRKILGAAAITTARGAYALEVAPDDVDVLRFERLLDDAERQRDPALLRQALDLWRGEPFGQHLSDWFTDYQVPRLTERYLAAVERWADLELADHLAGGELPGELVGELRELSVRHPFRESLWARLLRALTAAGRPGEALAAYEDLRRRLADELGVDLAPELRQIHADLLAGTTAARATGTAVPRQLPAGIDDLVGRDRELRLLDELAGRRGGALVVIHGTGGVGKTTLAVHWAYRVREEFPDGQLFVDLRGFGPGDPLAPPAALATMLHGLGVPGERIPADVDGRAALLRTTLAGRRALVVLDNARDADQVRPLLPGTGLVVLVTSRNQLRGLAARERAHRLALDVLPASEATAMLAERLKADAVAYDEASLDRLAEFCGGLPLALAVAAERAAQGPLEDLVRQLTDSRERLGVLETGADLSTSVRAVMSWSYRALDPEPAELFRLLGLYPGRDFVAPAAAALAGVDRTTASRLLDRLAEASLVGPATPGRYAMHDLVRAFAAEQAGSERSDTAPARLYNWFAWSASNAKVAIQGRPLVDRFGSVAAGVTPLTFQDPRQALSWFDAEYQSLLGTMRAASDLALYDEVITLGLALWTYLNRISSHAQGIATHEIALAAARAAGNEVAEAGLLNQLAGVHVHIDEPEQALRYFQQALALYRKVGDAVGECSALGNVGLAYNRCGRVTEAIATIEQAVAIGRALRQDHHVAHALNNLAMAYHDAGRGRDAIAAATEAVGLRREAGQRVDEAFALDSLAVILLAQGDHAGAVSCQQEALEIHRAAGSRWYEAYALRELGRAYRAAGDFAQVRAHCDEALRIMDEIGAEDSTELSRSDLHNLVSGA